MTVADEVLLGALITSAGVWLASASFERRHSPSGLGGIILGFASALLGAALWMSGLARSASDFEPLGGHLILA